MRRLPIVVLLIALCPGSVHAANWGLGANLGLQVFQTSDVEDFSVISWPSSDLVPGLRVSFAGEDSPHEIYVDSSLLLASASSESTREFLAQLGYSYVFPSAGALSTYVTGGVGALFAGIDITDAVNGDINLSSTATMFGAGFGVRHRMGNGHGTLRAEVRYDRHSRGEDQGFVLLPEGDSFGLKLGFDLWDQEVGGR